MAIDTLAVPCLSRRPILPTIAVKPAQHLLHGKDLPTAAASGIIICCVGASLGRHCFDFLDFVRRFVVSEELVLPSVKIHDTRKNTQASPQRREKASQWLRITRDLLCSRFCVLFALCCYPGGCTGTCSRGGACRARGCAPGGRRWGIGDEFPPEVIRFIKTSYSSYIPLVHQGNMCECYLAI